MTITKRQRKMSYRSSVTVNFVCATKFCFDPPFFQRFFPSSALGPVLRASHIKQEPTGSFPRPSFLAPRFLIGSFRPSSLFQVTGFLAVFRQYHTKTGLTKYHKQLFHERALDTSFWIADEVRSTESAIISAYPTSVCGITVLLNTKHLALFMLRF